MAKHIMAAVLLMAVMIMTAGCSGAPGTGTPVTGDNESASVIGSLSTSVSADNMNDYDFTPKAMEYLEYIGKNLKNRNFDGSGENNVHDAALSWIESELRAAGYTDDQVREQPFEAKWDNGQSLLGCNVVLTIEGEDPSRQIIAGAHFDGDGLGDNGSGTAMLLAEAVCLKEKDILPHYTLKFIFFDGEEDGCIGSTFNADQMSEEEIGSTIYMINMDALAFGDYCNIYGGSYGEDGIPTDNSQLKSPQATEAYAFAADTAENLGFTAYRTEDLDGYYAQNGRGPEIEDNAVYTNPWTPDNPAPENNSVMSPATLPQSDHIGYSDKGIEYIYFEATNWYAESADNETDAMSYTGYVDTHDYDRGEHGMFMNTEYDTWENLNSFYPGRADKHFHIYSPLLSALLLTEGK